MDARAYIRHVRAVMGAHGHYIQGVTRAAPTDPSYCYTVGLQRLRRPRPELITFGLELCCGPDLLNAAVERTRCRAPLRPGEVLAGLLPADAERPVRVDAARPEWVEAYAGMVEPVLERPGREVPMLQLVLADQAGRWPEDPLVDPTLLQAQPLLACDVPWRAPIAHTAAEDLFFRERPDAELVAVPVYGPSQPEGRYELLRAERATATTARLRDVPWVADHVAYGDLVEVTASPTVPGLPDRAAVMGALVEKGPCATRAFRLPPPDADVDLLSDVLWDLVETDQAWMATTCSTLHVNTAQPDAFDAAVRSFVRDGLLVPRGLHSEADEFLPPGGDCPDCVAGLRRLRR